MHARGEPIEASELDQAALAGVGRVVAAQDVSRYVMIADRRDGLESKVLERDDE